MALIKDFSIDDLRALLVGQISDGRIKLPVKVNDTSKSCASGVYLFFNGNSDWVSTSKAPYYNTGVQVACRHNDYATSRQVAFNAIEYINENRKTITGVYYIPDNTPVYAGIDDKGGYVHTFDVMLKGAK